MNKIALAALALFAVASAQAQSQAPDQTKAYVLVAAGSTHLAEDCSGTVTCNASGSGSKLVGGWRLSNDLSAELGYASFGSAKGSVLVGSTLAKVEIKTSAIMGGVAFNGKFGSNMTGTARVGLASVTTKANVDALPLATYSESTSKMKPYVGLALGYAFTPAVSVEAALDSTQAETTASKGGVRLLSLGAKFAF